ncbi:hypothetical protein [Kribbella qitaiheensis]|nr:hypothetical protein [Kribbella qitaiheensis]
MSGRWICSFRQPGAHFGRIDSIFLAGATLVLCAYFALPPITTDT